jgi:hypothetical protein
LGILNTGQPNLNQSKSTDVPSAGTWVPFALLLRAKAALTSASIYFALRENVVSASKAMSN